MVDTQYFFSFSKNFTGTYTALAESIEIFSLGLDRLMYVIFAFIKNPDRSWRDRSVENKNTVINSSNHLFQSSKLTTFGLSEPVTNEQYSQFVSLTLPYGFLTRLG